VPPASVCQGRSTASQPGYFREPDRSQWVDVFAIRDIASSASRQPRHGIPLTDDDLRDIATAYRDAVRLSRAPTQTLADGWGVSRPTMSRWIAMARKRGFLGEARQGVAG